MAVPSVTYSLVAGTNADAAQVNTNFNDLITFLTNQVVHVDGTKAMTAQLSLVGSDPTLANHATRKSYVDALVAANLPPGMVVPYAGTAAPSGWLGANGQAVSRTTYAALFAITSTTFGGGDGSTTFNLPDLRGRVPAGVDNMFAVGAASRLTIFAATLGAAGGDQNLHAHNHGVNDPGHTHSGSYVFTGVNASAGLSVSAGGFTQAMPGVGTGISIQNSGAGSGQNVQPSVVLNYLIKT